MAYSITHLNWQNQLNIDSITYNCGHCGAFTAPAFGYYTPLQSGFQAYICLCSNCNKPTYILQLSSTIVEIVPGKMPGESITLLPEDVGKLYDEARKSSAVGSYTATVLTCRKILMHIAVSTGADEGKKFIEYIEYLSEKGYIPPNGKDWVDHIRKRGNEANHEIKIMTKDQSDVLLRFTEMLLRFVYEFAHLIPNKEAEDTEG